MLYDIVKDGKLIVATNAEFPPFEYLDGDTITGFDIDLVLVPLDLMFHFMKQL